MGIDSIGSMFIDFGYAKMDMLSFPGKKLTAYWYAPPKDQEHLPRVFISELRVRPCMHSVLNGGLWHNYEHRLVLCACQQLLLCRMVSCDMSNS